MSVQTDDKTVKRVREEIEFLVGAVGSLDWDRWAAGWAKGTVSGVDEARAALRDAELLLMRAKSKAMSEKQQGLALQADTVFRMAIADQALRLTRLALRVESGEYGSRRHCDA